MASVRSKGRLIIDGQLQTADATAGMSVGDRGNGFAFTSIGETYVQNLGSAGVPSGAIRGGGMAFGTDGRLYVTTDAPSTSVSRGKGLTTRPDGALHVTTDPASTLDSIGDGIAIAPNGALRISAGSSSPIFSAAFADAGAGAVNMALLAGSGSATFTRAGVAYTTLSTGLLGQVASGVARSTYDSAGNYLGYLAEGQRTNLCLQSEALGTTWIATNATVGANAIAAPNGAVTADALIEDTTNGQHQFAQLFTKAASALPYAASAYIKKGTRNWVWLFLGDGTPTDGSLIYFDVNTGVVGNTVNIGAGFTSVSGAITAAGNGFYRCVIRATSDNETGLIFTVGAASGNAADISAVTYAGIAADQAIYPWGMQVEQATYASSYIPTTTVAATRVIDLLSYPAAGNMAVLQNYTIGMKASLGGLGSTASNRTPISSSTNYVPYTYLESASGLLFLSDTVGAASASKAIADKQTLNSLAVRKSGTTLSAFVAGVKGTDATASTQPGVEPTTLYIGGSSAINALFGTVRNVKIYGAALSDAEVAAL